MSSWWVNKCVRNILSHIADGPLLLKDFVELLEVDPIGSQHSLEDLGLVQLYRVYSLEQLPLGYRISPLNGSSFD
jgi:hypothetical protein